MKRETKKTAAVARKIAWNTAIFEGRMVRVETNDSLTFAPYETRQDAAAAVTRYALSGFSAEIVDPEKADLDYVGGGR